MTWKSRHREVARAHADGQWAITRCACGWYFKGLVRDGKAAFRSHRERCKLRVVA